MKPSLRLHGARSGRDVGLVVCSKNGKKLYGLDRSWAHARKLAGITDVRLHDLRHSVATDAIMNGAQELPHDPGLCR